MAIGGYAAGGGNIGWWTELFKNFFNAINQFFSGFDER
jgi:hypothetical protein